MNFAQALEKLFTYDISIRRESWGDSMYVCGPESLKEIVTENHVHAGILPIGTNIEFPPTINIVHIVDEDHIEIPYMPTQSDLLGSDWLVIGDIPDETPVDILLNVHEIIKP